MPPLIRRRTDNAAEGHSASRPEVDIRSAEPTSNTNSRNQARRNGRGRRKPKSVPAAQRRDAPRQKDGDRTILETVGGPSRRGFGLCPEYSERIDAKEAGRQNQHRCGPNFSSTSKEGVGGNPPGSHCNKASYSRSSWFCSLYLQRMAPARRQAEWLRQSIRPPSTVSS